MKSLKLAPPKNRERCILSIVSYFARDTPKDRQDSVLIHEIIEIINDDYELELPHKTIQCLEEVLHQVIKDNPDIFKG